MPPEPIDPKTVGKIELPQPAWVAPRSRPALRVGLRQIMLLVVFAAVVALAGRNAAASRSPVEEAILGALIGVGIAFLGWWLAARMGTFAFVGWLFVVLGIIGATGAVFGVLVIPSIPILIGVLIYIHVLQRRSQQAGLLWVLAVAAEREIPLAPGVEAYAQQARRPWSDRAHTLAALLLQGQSLSTALDWVPHVVPWDAPLLIRVGESVGRVAVGLKEAASTRSRRSQALRHIAGRVGYILAVLTAAQAIVAFVLYFIVPKFEAIFKDFGVNLPAPTILLLQITRALLAFVPAIGLVELAAGVYLLLALRGRGLQAAPLVGRLFQLQHRSLILRSLAIVVEAGGKLDAAFGVMAESYPSKRIRKKIARANAATRGGASWTDSLRYVGLLSSGDVGVLDAASRAGNLAWALRALAASGEQRFAYRLEIGSHLAFVLTILGLGALVLGITVGLFMPLVTLIERLSS